MKQIFLVSTLFEIVCLAAGIDSGAYERSAPPKVLRRRPGTDLESEPASISERLLLVSNNAHVLEQVTPLTEVPGATSLLTRFDRVIHLNDLIAPQHPSSWSPADHDLPMLERLIRKEWDLSDEELELILESPQVNPAIALGRVFGDALIRVHADGLMSFGPTRNKIPLSIGQRLTTLHYLPLVEQLRPQLLSEFSIEPRPLELSAFASVVEELAAEFSDDLDDLLADIVGSTSAFAVGQYLSALGLVTPAEEEELHRAMIRKAAECNCRTLVFKPHPAAPIAASGSLRRAAEENGIELRIIDTPIIAEVILHRLKPQVTIGIFSTALATARTAYGIRTEAVGTDLMLDRISPYQNSNRVPLTILNWLDGRRTDALDNQEIRELQFLVAAVSYCMQPEITAPLRKTAENYLALNAGTEVIKYFKRRRLMKLNLPGGLSRTRNPKTIARKLGGVGYRLGKYELEGLLLKRRPKK